MCWPKWTCAVSEISRWIFIFFIWTNIIIVKTNIIVRTILLRIDLFASFQFCKIMKWVLYYYYYTLYKSFNLYNRCSVGSAWNAWRIHASPMQWWGFSFSISISINNNNNNPLNAMINNYKHTSYTRGCCAEQIKLGRLFRKRDLLWNRLTSCNVNCCFAITFNNKKNVSITT